MAKLDLPVAKEGGGKLPGQTQSNPVKPSQTGRSWIMMRIKIRIKIKIRIRSSYQEVGPVSSQSNPVKPSQTQSNPVKPSQTQSNPVKPVDPGLTIRKTNPERRAGG